MYIYMYKYYTVNGNVALHYQLMVLFNVLSYRRDLLFWVNEEFHSIVQARLSDGSSVTVLVDGETTDPGTRIVTCIMCYI